MASANHIPCGPCMFDDVTKDSWRWCTNCEEGLCEDCENVHRKGKTTRNHKVIAMEDYRKIENVSISQVCEHHGENLEWFCKSHDEVLCVVCVPSMHKSCSDVIPINVNAANARQSSALSDLEETIEGTLRNVKQCIRNRESATKEIEKQELEIKTMVLDTRAKINGQLDKLQEKLLRELRSTSDNCKSKYMKIIQMLKSTEEMLTKLREETIHMKQFSSDIQVFLGTRQTNKRIVSEVEYMKSEIGDTKDYDVKVSFHSLIERFENEVGGFGQIKVNESASRLDFKYPKIGQAQNEINVQASKNIFEKKLQLIKTFQIQVTNEMEFRGCVILPNGHILIANYTKDNNLIEYSHTGEHIRDISVTSSPYDISVIDPNRIVVTYGDALFLEIIDSNTFNVDKKVSLQKSCLGVSHEDGRLYVVYGSCIQVLDLSGKQLETLKLASKDAVYIITSKSRIFYADYNKCTVHCCLLNGKELWELKSDSIKFPKGLSVDNDNNVFVLGYISDKCNNNST